ncbi:MAG: bifunctional phosphoribosylaminoimidazolecarboxamide formyltransferase/IMP cyclohydrolase [Thermoguttaceae bacterium]
MDSPQIKRAIISVSDKMGLSAFAKGLAGAGVEIYSTGGTRQYLLGEGVPVKDIAEYTGFPEMMNGRLKTLHPKVYGGILARRDHVDDMKALIEHGINSFELVVVNLYPFEATVAKENVTESEAIENIDIGGPSMLRAAAKNHQFVTVVTNNEQYSHVLEQIQEKGATTLQLRRSLAKDAFVHTAAYDAAISQFFIERSEEGTFPDRLNTSYKRCSVLRYGENPHQQAALYSDPKCKSANVVNARQLNGKELSYNNLLDLDSALSIVRSFKQPTVSVIKHNNPCGAGSAEKMIDALKKGMEGDPLSAFGSVLGFNGPLDAECAEYLATPGLFVEAIIATEFSDSALEILKTKPKWSANVRLLSTGSLAKKPGRWLIRPIEGGALLQEADIEPDDERTWQVVTESKPSSEMMDDLRFAWEMVRHVKSNAITLCKNLMLLGAGAGQMSRVDSVEIAIKKAGDRAKGSVLGSDAFFPFPDSIERAAEVGIGAIIQPGGSRGDESVIEMCNKYKIPMIFTGKRHFRH